jgi:hypothetical protein
MSRSPELHFHWGTCSVGWGQRKVSMLHSKNVLYRFCEISEPLIVLLFSQLSDVPL